MHLQQMTITDLNNNYQLLNTQNTAAPAKMHGSNMEKKASIHKKRTETDPVFAASVPKSSAFLGSIDHPGPPKDDNRWVAPRGEGRAARADAVGALRAVLQMGGKVAEKPSRRSTIGMEPMEPMEPSDAQKC